MPSLPPGDLSQGNDSDKTTSSQPIFVTAAVAGGARGGQNIVQQHAESVANKMGDVAHKAGNIVSSAGSSTSNQQSQHSRIQHAPVATDEPGGEGGRKQKNKHSLDYMMRSQLAGGLAGCAAKTTVAPLDRVKILFQTSNPQFAKYTSSWVGFGRAMGDIYARDGVTGLFRGHSATLLKIYPYAAIKFLAYEQFRAILIGSRKDHETWLRRFSAGALAGVSSVLLTYPLEMIRVRLAFETKHRSSSLADICKKIYYEDPIPQRNARPNAAATGATGSVAAAAKESIQMATPRSGVINFYRGFSMTLLGMVPYAGTSFLTHDTASDVFRRPGVAKYATLPHPTGSPRDKPAPLRAWAELVAGGISGAVSQTISYPLEVIRRRMQVGGAVGDGHRLRIAETAAMILRERGPAGFFVGLTIGYIKIVPMYAVSFYVYERGKTYLNI